MVVNNSRQHIGVALVHEHTLERRHHLRRSIMVHNAYPGAVALRGRNKDVVENSEGAAACCAKGLQRTGVSCLAQSGHAPRLNVLGAPGLEPPSARIGDGIHDLRKH